MKSQLRAVVLRSFVGEYQHWLSLRKDEFTGRIVRQPSWQEIVDESSIRRRSGESLWPRVMRDAREGVAEALTGETDRPGIEPRNQESGMPTPLCETEGNTEQGANRKSCNGPARSETLSMSGSLLPRSWEVSSVPASEGVGGEGL